MQLLGSTPQEKENYKRALADAKRAQGAGFDLTAFNNRWIEDNNIIEKAVPTTPAVIEAQEKEDGAGFERVAGDILGADDLGGAGNKLRDVVRDIVGAIDAYKVEHDIVTFSRVKNGTLQFDACLSAVYDNVVKPSRILKRAPYEVQKINGAPLSNNNAYDADILIKFIDICKRLCGREGLCFNRTLYMALTGVSDEYLRGGADYLTSARVGLWEKVLTAEHGASINMAYNTDIGNMRNLNEGEAVVRSDNIQGAQAVGLSALRRLEG